MRLQLWHEAFTAPDLSLTSSPNGLTVLKSHPGVYECAVLGVPDEQWGEVPKALVVLKPGAKVTESELIQFSRERLAQFKIPKSVKFVEALPKGGTAKILKAELREKYWVGFAKRVH